MKTFGSFDFNSACGIIFGDRIYVSQFNGKNTILALTGIACELMPFLSVQDGLCNYHEIIEYKKSIIDNIQRVIFFVFSDGFEFKQCYSQLDDFIRLFTE